jgi:N-methylhydantoinase A/oxoprolinase/acetone carboxylase beta subunit
VLEALDRQRQAQTPPPHAGRFAWRLRDGHVPAHGSEHRLWSALGPEPRPLEGLLRSPIAENALRNLVGRGLVAVAGLTPSDAMHVLGGQDAWNREAARLGTALMLRERRGWLPLPDDEAIEDFAREIQEAVTRRAVRALCEAAFAQDPGTPPGRAGWGPLGEAMIERIATGGDFSRVLRLEPRLAAPLVAIGAPVGSYYDVVARRLGAKLVIPDHAAVTNAVGAVAGVVLQSAELVVTLPKDGRHRLHAPEGPRDFDDPEAAIAAGEALAAELALEAARRAGAGAPSVETVVHRKSVERLGIAGLLIEARIVATATGRPTAAA